MLPKEFPRYKLLIFGCIVLGLLLILLVSLIKQKKTLQENMQADKELNDESYSEVTNPELPTVNVPAMTFAAYNTGATTINVPPTVKVYTFRSQFTPDYVASLAGNFGFTENKNEQNTLLYYNSAESETRGYLKFNLDNGNYEFSSYGNHLLPLTSQVVSDNVRNYLLTLNLIDETVNCDITYERTDLTGANFIECHRDWLKTGLPIFNFAGLLNIPDLQSLKDIKVGYVDEDSPENANIINVSTGQNGKERPDDFNTVTVAVDSNNNILSIKSNLRLVENVSEFSQNDLLTPVEAINQFRQGSSKFSLIEPVDDNDDWTTVFPENTAYDLNAQVNDVMLAYIENPFTGKSLSPVFIARGVAQSSSGYPVKFLQAIPAIKNEQSMESIDGEVAGLLAANEPLPTQFYDESLKLGTFNPDKKMLSSGECVPAESQLNPILSLGDYGTIGKFTIAAEGQSRMNNWFLIPASSQNLPEINNVVAAFDALAQDGSGSKIRELNKLQQEWEKFNLCPLRVTGGSPTLFGYGKAGQIYEVKVGRSIVYLKTNSDKSVYYEYQPVSFNKPVKGWNISNSKLSQFAQSIKNQLRLTESETEKLVFELNLAASKVFSDNLFIGLIDQSEINQKLPLYITPKVDAVRYHFYVTKASNVTTEPNLTPIKRTTEMVLEVGAVAQ